MKLTADELMKFNARWIMADAKPGYPCRVSLCEADVGERVLLVPFAHHNVDSPYRSSGPVFVREHADMALLAVNEVPDSLRHRLLSLRGYDSANMMLAAEVLPGDEVELGIMRQFRNDKVAYIHIHNANPGCYSCSVYRA